MIKFLASDSRSIAPIFLIFFIGSYSLINYVPNVFLSVSIHSLVLLMLSTILILTNISKLKIENKIGNFLVFSLLIFISSLYVNFANTSLIILRSMILNFVCLAFVYFAGITNRSTLNDKLISFITIYVLLSAVLVVLQVFVSDKFYLSEYITTTLKIKYGLGFVSSPNLQGILLCYFTSILCVEYLISNKNNFYLLLAICFGLWCVFLSLSRAAWVSFFCVILVIFFKVIGQKKYFKKYLNIFFLLLVLIFSFKLIDTRLDTYISSKNNSTVQEIPLELPLGISTKNISFFSDFSSNTRLVSNSIAIEVVRDNFLWGVGLGEFPIFYEKNFLLLTEGFKKALDSRSKMTNHNSYLQILTELGGGFCVLLFYLIALTLVRGISAGIDSPKFKYPLGLLAVAFRC
jgi:hypothetical protein